MVRHTDALVLSKVLEAGGASDELARGSRRAQANNNGTGDMLNIGTGNLHNESSFAVSHHSIQVKACSGDVMVTIGSRKRQVVMYRIKKKRRGIENRTKGWAYMPKVQILQKYPRAYTIYP